VTAPTKHSHAPRRPSRDPSRELRASAGSRFRCSPWTRSRSEATQSQCFCMTCVSGREPACRYQVRHQLKTASPPPTSGHSDGYRASGGAQPGAFRSEHQSRCSMSGAPCCQGVAHQGSVRGSPKWGSMPWLPKRVMAEIWVPSRVSTNTPRAWAISVCGSLR